MAQISKELLESEWETYNGLKYFLKDKELFFGKEMNYKYRFLDNNLENMTDRSAYDLIKEKYVIQIEDISQRQLYNCSKSSLKEKTNEIDITFKQII